MDLARGHVAALAWMNGREGVEVFNLGTGTGYSVLDLVNTFQRVNNIQAKSGRVSAAIKLELLQDEAEKKLVEHLNQLLPTINELYGQGKYDQAMTTLAELRDDVDNFFEKVMVNDNDEAIKNNRLAILNKLSQVFSKTADISVLY